MCVVRRYHANQQNQQAAADAAGVDAVDDANDDDDDDHGDEAEAAVWRHHHHHHTRILSCQSLYQSVHSRRCKLTVYTSYCNVAVEAFHWILNI